jgi:hypothetical protein
MKELIEDIDFILGESPKDLIVIGLFLFIEISFLSILWWAL